MPNAASRCLQGVDDLARFDGLPMWRDQTCDFPAMLGDDDRLTRLHPVQKPRKMSLCLICADGRHRKRLVFDWSKGHHRGTVSAAGTTRLDERLHLGCQGIGVGDGADILEEPRD